MAVIFGVVHAGLAPAVAGGSLRPNLMLVAVVVVTVLFGLGSGGLWAFLGGVAANLLTTDTLGLVPLGLLLAAGAVAAGRRLAGDLWLVLAVAGGFIGSVLVDLVVATVPLTAPDGAAVPTPASLAVLLVPSALLNGVLAGAAAAMVRAAAFRMGRLPTPT